MNKKRINQKGTVMVEASLIFIVFFLMVIAIIDFGQLLFFHQVMTERATAGARWAVVHSFDASDTSNVKNMVVYNTSSPTDSSRRMFGLSTSMVTVTPLPSSTNVKYIQVQIDFPMRFITPYLAQVFSRSFRAVRPVESLGATT